MSGRFRHVHVSAMVICTSSRRQIGQLPLASRTIAACSGQLQAASRRTGTSAILQSGQLPALASTMSGCIGQVWTSGPQVVIRYYEAQAPDGDKVPICAVARLGDDQMQKRPESKPGTAILDGSVAAAFIVDAFR